MSEILDAARANLDDIHLVEAAAGTGKTYNITAIYLRLVAEKGVPVDQILVMTYTRAATAELRERIDRRMREALAVLRYERSPEQGDQFMQEVIEKYRGNDEAITRLEKAIHDLDLAAIHTIHGFCQQVLQEQVFESGTLFDVDFSSNEAALQEETHDDIWLNMLEWAQAEQSRSPVFHYLVDKIKEPDGIKPYSGKIKGNPYIRIRNEEVSQDLSRLCDDLQQVWDKLKQQWDPEWIENFFSNSNYVDGRSYKQPNVTKWVKSISDILGEPAAVSSHEGYFFDKFKISHVADKLKKEAGPVEKLKLAGFFQSCQDLIDKLAELQESVLITMLKNFRTQFEVVKKRRNVRTYDDLLTSLDSALDNHELKSALLNQYPAALIDEFQDTDPVQFNIFRKIYLNGGQPDAWKKSLFLIGDPKQSIYSFRGADIFTYLNARKQVDYSYTLSTNFRSAHTLVASVNRILTHCGDTPFLNSEIEYKKTDAKKSDNDFRIYEKAFSPEPLQFLTSGRDHDTLNKDDATGNAVANTCNEIQRLIHQSEKIEVEGRDLQAGDIAILVRSHTQGEKIKQRLQQLGIRSVDQSKQSVYQSVEADLMLMFLHTVREPSNPGLVRALLCSRIGGFSFSRLEALDHEEENRLYVLETFRQLHEQFINEGFTPVWRTFLNKPFPVQPGQSRTPYQTILHFYGGERTLTNLMHLAELISEYGRSGNHGLEDIIKWLNLKIQEADASEEEQLRLESDEELVKIITMHSAKGLQFPVVFCPFLWDPVYTSMKAPYVYHQDDHRWVDLLGLGEETSKIAMHEQVAEQLRLAYVAITRAQYRCYISWEAYQDQHYAPLTGFLTGSQALISNLYSDSTTKKKSKKEKSKENKEFCEALYNEIDQLSAGEGIGITESPAIISDSSGRSSQQKNHIPFQPRNWQRGAVTPSWFVTSYTSLKQGHMSEPDDPFADEDLEDPTETEAAISDGRSIFSFPKGAQAGIFMHKIFEDIDFQWHGDRIRSKIEELLEIHGFDSDWLPVIQEMIQNTLNRQLIPGDNPFAMKQLADCDCINEMQFHFHLKRADINEISEIISGANSNDHSAHQKLEGFMSGFIDLVFEHDGRFYILDYKSDYLGDSPDDYSSERMHEHMQERGYNLQYHIYTVALVRYLKSRVPGFDYEKHIGGVLYLYLRGMPTVNATYFDLPDENVITALDNYFG